MVSSTSNDAVSIVKSVEVAVSVLEILTESNDPVRVTDIANRLGMTKARISRHLQTLTALGMVERARGGVDGYVFGPKLLKFGRAAVYRSNIVELARPYLAELCQETGHTALLTTPARGGALVVASAPSVHEPGVMIHPGTLLSLPGSPAARVIHFFAGQKPEAPNIRTNMTKFGIDFAVDPRGTGLGSIAVPLFEPDGTICATVGLILSSSLLVPEPAPALAQAIRDAAADIQRRYAEGATSPLLEALGADDITT